MAISSLGSLTGTNTNGNDVTIDLSSLSLAQNDIVVICGGHGNATSSSAASISTSGYTTLQSESSGNDYSGIIAYKRMGVSPDTSVTGTGGGNASNGVAYTVLAFRGVHTTTAIDATSIETTGLSGAPNSNSITTVTNGAYVLSGAVKQQDVVTANVSPPTGYNSSTVASASDSNPISAYLAWKIVTSAGAENPSSWTYTTFDSGNWWAATVALRPDVAGANQDGPLSATATATVDFVGTTAAPSSGIFSATANATIALIGAPYDSRPFAMTGTETSTWVGDSVSSQPQPFSMTGTATIAWVGALAGAGKLESTGTAAVIFAGNALFGAALHTSHIGQAQFIGGISHLESVREDIRSRGAVSVRIGSHAVG